MRKFSTKICEGLTIWYSHYLSSEFIEKECVYFKKNYPLRYLSRKFDKPAVEMREGICVWCLDNKDNRVGKPAIIMSNGYVRYYENGEKVK